MKFWIIQTGEPLHCDYGNPRPMRAMNLANTLLDRGHEVVIWSSRFYHQQKSHRCRSFSSIKFSERLTINLIPSPGYKRNIGLGRIFDHVILAVNFLKEFKKYKNNLPDAAFIGYPPIEVAYITNRWLRLNCVKTILDVKDQWPSLFLEPFSGLLKNVARLLFHPYFFLGRKTMQDATLISSMSNSYLDWVSLFSGRSVDETFIASPLTVFQPMVDQAALAEAVLWWDQRGLDLKTRKRFIFVGSFMSVYDFKPIRELAERFLRDFVECEFVICGDGGSSNELRDLMSGLNNVFFPGWVDYPKIKVLADSSSAAIIPYKNIENFTRNVPNKVVDSFSLGLPIITTLQGEVGALVNDYRVGALLEQGLTDEAYLFCKTLLVDEVMFKKMSKNALDLYREKFDFDQIYGNLAQSMEALGN